MDLKLSHIAVACPSIGELAAKLKNLTLRESERHSVPTEQVTAAMIPVEVSKNFRIELLEPTTKESPISKFLEKHPRGGLHHVCFEVSTLQKWHERLVAAGIEILPPGIRKGARGSALFIHPRAMGGVLVELEEIGP